MPVRHLMDLTISRIPTTLRYSPLFPVSEDGAVDIMPNDVPVGVIVLSLKVIVLAIGVAALEENCLTGAMALGRVVVLVGSNRGGGGGVSCTSG